MVAANLPPGGMSVAERIQPRRNMEAARPDPGGQAIGLVARALRIRPHRGYKFSTYAYWWNSLRGIRQRQGNVTSLLEKKAARSGCRSPTSKHRNAQQLKERCSVS